MRTVSLTFIRKLIYVVISFIALISFWETYTYLWLRSSIFVDGRELSVRSRPVTVGAILRQENIPVGPIDIVVPPMNAPMPRRGEIHIIRVRETIKEVEEQLPFILRWKERSTRNLRTVEMQKGTLRTKVSKVKIIYHDNREFGRVVLNERTTKKTVYRLALMNREGQIEKVYDLSKTRKMNVVATAYYTGDPLCWGDGTVTCLGLKMQRGIVAVDPKVIPLRTRIYVSGYGYGYAGDTGNLIKGKRVDLGVKNAEEEKEFMHRPVTVYVLEESKTW